ncbi:MAG: tRNA epoxyqueuosine(34) reductase QueG [Chloroflexi bacterium]|nr:MAG: tRNA epoxyqueuosine(34) reductase QueG [Chloroflexota bacterium]PIE82196.1 MAG: tRNA epoxyqueuosine(34) reductase QueG [Chloroflexota bacterium]
MMNDELIHQLEKKVRELGFNFFGMVPAQPARRLEAYLVWVAQERHGKMGYLARPDRISRRQDLNLILPGVQTIICVGLNYFPGKLPAHIAQDPGRGRISNYAWSLDYHDVMTPRLKEIATWLQAQTDETVDSRVYVDTGAILERDHGETAVFGFTGKNTMLINPRHGSFFFLGEILTTLPLANNYQSSTVKRQLSMPSCGSCQRCQDDCPTGAFPAPYVLDAQRCISYLTIELKDWIPRELRPLMRNWIYGCDVCQEVCPFNRFAQTTHEAGFYPEDWLLDPQNWDHVAPRLLDILTLDEKEFAARFAHSPIKRIKRRRLVRNACVAAGNWGKETAVPTLVTLLSDPEPLIRGHAAWALHQIGTDAAKTAVAHALNYETDEKVREELKH